MPEVLIREDVSEKLKSAGAERNVISCIYASQESWLTASSLLPEDFAYPLNRALWQVIDHLWEKQVTPSPVTIYEALPKNHQEEIDHLGGWSYIDNLGSMPIDPSSVSHELKRLKAYTVKRRAFQASQKIEQLALTEDNPVKVQEEAELTVNEISGPVAEEVALIGSIADSYVREKAMGGGQLPGLPSGFEELDKAIDGFQPARMYVVAGIDKAGKSAWLLNVGKHIAVDLGKPILWIATEHPIEDDFSRLLSLTSEVQEKHINNGFFMESEKAVRAVDGAKDRLKVAPFHFIHLPHFNLNKIARIVKKYRRQHGIELLIFDYLKLPEDNMGSRDKWADVGMLAYGLKNLASVEKIPVLTAVQINRQGIGALSLGGEVGTDSFALSQDIGRALSVALIIRTLNKKEEEGHGQFMDTPRRILRVDKNRHGADGAKLLIAFDAPILKMTEKERIE